MDKLEEDDIAPEIFEECDNNFSIKKTECNLEQKNRKKCEDMDHSQQTANNQHVVHVGIVVVLLTICLGLTNVPKCLVNCVENTSARNEKLQETNKDIIEELQQIGNTHILERLLEYKDICKDLEIFTKDLKQKHQKEEREEKASCNNEINANNDLIDMMTSSASSGEEDNIDGLDNSGSGSSGQVDDCASINRNKNKKSKYSIKTTNNKNGFNKYNKSTKAKNQKKDLKLNKKTSTAEPIIYLFALIFIYLLLKAASDINQHYKSQNKNDKRLRRCSLQSYAQSHRSDRRASKAPTTELALKQKQRLKSLARCSEQDQPNYHYNYHRQSQTQAQHQAIMDVSSQKFCEKKQQTTPGTPVRSNISSSSNWQLLRQHTTTQSLDNSDILYTSAGGGSTEKIFTPRVARRCSVPAALSFHRQNISTASPLSLVNDPANLNVSLSRRTSVVASSLALALDPNESLMPETKRRVRMINRH